MTDSQTVASHTIEPSQLEVRNSATVVEQEKLNSRLAEYFKTLVKQHPDFRIERKVARHRIAEELKQNFPILIGWESEMDQVLEWISDHLKSLPVAGPTSEIEVQIFVKSPMTRLQSTLIPELKANATT